jgi:hypothetical protein
MCHAWAARRSAWLGTSCNAQCSLQMTCKKGMDVQHQLTAATDRQLWYHQLTATIHRGNTEQHRWAALDCICAMRLTLLPNASKRTSWITKTEGSLDTLSCLVAVTPILWQLQQFQPSSADSTSSSQKVVRHACMPQAHVTVTADKHLL